MSSLPKATSSTAYVDITLIETGTIDIPLWMLHQGGPEGMIRIPVYCFLIEHGSLGKKVMFDLGVPKVFRPSVTITYNLVGLECIPSSCVRYVADNDAYCDPG